MKKRNFFGFDDIDKIFEEMLKRMEAVFEDFQGIEDIGFKTFFSHPNTKVYGYSITIDSNGKPKIREFGNIHPNEEIIDERENLNNIIEPLTELFKEKDKIRIVSEMPGIKKKDIKLNIVDNDLLEIKANSIDKKYYKKIKLPFVPDKSKVKMRYVNGILEIIIPIKNKK